MSRWVGQELHVGPVRLESGCKIGMRAGVADHVTVGRGSWITPLTPVLGDVGPGGDLGGSAGALRRPLHRARAHGAQLPAPRLRSGCSEALNVLLQVVLEFCAPGPAHRRRQPGGRPPSCSSERRSAPATTSRWHRGWRSSGTSGSTRSSPPGSPSSSSPCWAASSSAARPRRRGCIPTRGLRARSPPLPGEEAESDPAPVDLDHHRAVPARPRRRPFPARRRLGVRPDDQPRPGARRAPTPRCSGPTAASPTCSTTEPST